MRTAQCRRRREEISCDAPARGHSSKRDCAGGPHGAQASVRLLADEYPVEALALDEQIRGLAADLAKEQSLLVFGRGWNYATALEVALKARRIIAETAAEGHWHGTVVDDGSLIDRVLSCMVGNPSV